MDKLPIGVIRQIYEYDSTYKIKSGKVLKQMMSDFLYIQMSYLLKRGATVFATAQIAKPIWNSANRSIIHLIILMKVS